MSVKMLFHEKVIEESGNIVEIKIWSVPRSRTKPEGLKYSLAYIVEGERLIGYDNAEGKGHHRHHKGKEMTYRFSSVDQLFSDFRSDIKKVKK